MKKTHFFAILLKAVLLSACAPQRDTTNHERAFVLWGDFKADDFIHFYTIREVLENDTQIKRVVSDTVLYFEETVGDFMEIQLNNTERWGVSYLCFPGDTLQIIVTGKNAYRLKSNDPIRQRELDIQHDLESSGALINHIVINDRAKIEANYQENIDFLSSQVEEGMISDRYYEVMKTLMRCIRINQLTLPIIESKEPHAHVNIDSLFGFLPTDDKFLQLYTYNRTVLNLTKASLIQAGTPVTKAAVLHEAQNRFGGRIRDYVPTAFIRSEIVLSNTFDFADEELLVNAISDSVYNNIVSQSYNKKVDQESGLVTAGGHHLKLANILDVGKDTLLYVDFWASWCVPCRNAMQYYPPIFERYADDPVKFLFISIDKDSSLWKEAVADYPFMDPSNSFILHDPDYAKIVKDLEIHAIPRYIIFKNGEIYANHATRPNNIRTFNDFLSVPD